MKVKYANVEILCDRCIETDGKWMLYQGGVPIRQIVNVPDPSMIQAIDGVIEHHLSPDKEREAQLEKIQKMLEGLGDDRKAASLRQFIKELEGVLNET